MGVLLQRKEMREVSVTGAAVKSDSNKITI